MKAIGALKLSGVFIPVMLLLLPEALTAQITIKTRVEIQPKAKIAAEVNSGTPGCFGDGLKILRPCKVVATGTLSNDPPTSVTIWLSTAYTEFNITNTTDSLTSVGCDGAGVGFYSAWCTIVLDEYRVSVWGNTATIQFSGHCFSTPFSGRVELRATPLYGDPHMTTSASTNMMDAYSDTYVTIGARLADDAGHTFVYCNPIWDLFTIENPMGGITLKDYSDETNTGSSIAVPVGIENAYAHLLCDERNLPQGKNIDTVIRIRVESFGVSSVQDIRVKRLLPDHFSIEAEREPFATESVPIRVIARDRNEEEVDLDGQTAITLFADDGGSFIIGSDTLDDMAQVSYAAARSGKVLYLDFYGIPWSGPDPFEVTLEAWRSDDASRWGSGYLMTWPLCLAVQLSADKIGPGDTTKIVIMMKKPGSGTTIPFEDGEYCFSVEASGAPEYGMLHSISTNDTGAVLCGMQPFEFIATKSLSADSAVVEIRAEMVYDCDGGGGGAASISPGSNAADTGTQALPHQIQMRRAVSGGITDSDAKIVTTKKARRISMRDGLRVRLSAINATKKNKAETDKTAGKSMNTGSKGSFSAKINLKTSLSQEGEMCEPPVATVVVENECRIGTPPDQMFSFDKDCTVSRRMDNSFMVCGGGKAAVTFRDGITRNNSNKYNSSYDFFEGAIYATQFKAIITWGLCDANICGSSPCAKIDNNMSIVNSTNAQDVVDDLLINCRSAEIKNTDPMFLYYVPLSALEAHELAHVNDLEEKIVSYYAEMIRRINDIEPIRDWCRLSPDELLIATKNKLMEAAKIKQEIEERMDNEIDNNVDFNNYTDSNAAKAEIAKAREIAQQIKTNFNIQ
jgi:hypothetical protein